MPRFEVVDASTLVKENKERIPRGDVLKDIFEQVDNTAVGDALRVYLDEGEKKSTVRARVAKVAKERNRTVNFLRAPKDQILAQFDGEPKVYKSKPGRKAKEAVTA